MTVNEAIQYIHSMVWTRKATGYEHAKLLLEKMGNPEKKLKFVHIGGTNGKGSTASLIANVLKECGYKTGLYTSPYIFRFQERIQINGIQIEDDDLSEITEYVKSFADRLEDCPSEFALVCCIAFEYFARKKCDIVVLEVGMGGECDSTNVISCPEVALLTNIGLDHTEFLGHTIEEIGRTKAGIIKEGSSLVLYPCKSTIEKIVQEICDYKNSSYIIPDFEKIKLKERSLEGQIFDYKNWSSVFLPLHGEHQLNNATMVLEAIEILRDKGWELSNENVYRGLSGAKWPGRFEVIGRDPLFIVDGGHNPQCIEAIAQNIKDYLSEKNIVAVVGTLQDKDYRTMYKPILPYISRFICVTPPCPRALEADRLAEFLLMEGANADSSATIHEAVEKAIAEVADDGAIVCFGSLYMIADIYKTASQILR